MAKKRKKEEQTEASLRLAHDTLIFHLFKIFETIEGTKFTENRLIDLMAKITGDRIDARTVRKAKEGAGEINEGTSIWLAEALSRKIEQIIEQHGSSDRLALELGRTLERLEMVTSLEWVAARLGGDKPYIRKGDLIINRDDRHLVDEFNISLAVAPCPSSHVKIQYVTDKPAEIFEFQTMALLKYAIKFSQHNRNHQLDFTPRYGTNGRLEVIEPDVEALRWPSAYRRSRSEAMIVLDPQSTATQRLTTLIYGGYDPAPGHLPPNENFHFSFIQNALYRRICFTLDLTSYPHESLVEEPRLFVVCKLAGRGFNCCDLSNGREGQTIKPNQTIGQRRVWKFESLEQMMLGVHWKIDPEKIPEGTMSSREVLTNLLEDT